MIRFDRQAPPHLIKGTALGCASIVCLFKGVNSCVNLVNQGSEWSNKKRFMKIFELIAWMGLSILTGVAFYRTQRNFLDVKKNQYNPAYLEPFSKDLHSYEILHQRAVSEKSTLRNFCLAGFQSATAYIILDDLEGSKLQIRKNPRFDIARSTIRFIGELKKEAAVLKRELTQREERSKERFDILQGELSNYPLAKGVYIDYTYLCETPFRYLASSVCSPYLEHQSQLKKYTQYHYRLRDYAVDIVNARQFERCQQNYNFNGELNLLSSEEEINNLERSKETWIRGCFRSIFG